MWTREMILLPKGTMFCVSVLCTESDRDIQLYEQNNDTDTD